MVVEINNKVGHLYDPDTLVSEHTNRPVDENAEEAVSPEFWCEICQVKLRNAHIAIQHTSGKPHKKKTVARENQTMPNLNETLKRKSVVENNEGQVRHEPGPASKSLKSAKSDDPDLACNDCKKTFSSAIEAIQHFKGKKHANVITAQLEAKKTQTLVKWQRKGTGAGNPRGRGRSGSSRGRDGKRIDVLSWRSNINESGLKNGVVAGPLGGRMSKNDFGEPRDASSYSSIPYDYSDSTPSKMPNSYGFNRSNCFSDRSFNPSQNVSLNKFHLTPIRTQELQRNISNTNSPDSYGYPSSSSSIDTGLNQRGTGNYYTRDYWRQ